MVERSDKMWPTGEGNGKPLQYSCLENPMINMKRQKGRTMKDELARKVGAQYATRDQWRNNSRKNEGTSLPKQEIINRELVQLNPWEADFTTKESYDVYNIFIFF